MSSQDSCPGEPLTTSTKTLSAAAGVTQPFRQLGPVCEHVCGFHFYAHDMTRQVHAHHLCAHINEEFRQCIIYDSPAADARLIGIEYIISEKLFSELDAEEKHYWHSHDYEVRGGMLAMPMPKLVPEMGTKTAESQALLSLQKTYGKTWHTWQVDRGDLLPLGPPQLMMAFTQDGQLDESLDRKREQDEGIRVETKREERKEIPSYVPREGSDSWVTGTVYQVDVKPVAMKLKSTQAQ